MHETVHVYIIQWKFCQPWNTNTSKGNGKREGSERRHCSHLSASQKEKSLQHMSAVLKEWECVYSEGNAEG